MRETRLLGTAVALIVPVAVWYGVVIDVHHRHSVFALTLIVTISVLLTLICVSILRTYWGRRD